MTSGKNRRELRCPECGSTNVVPIVYGLPPPEAGEEAERGEIVLGGCCVMDDSSTRHCRDCEHEWGRFGDH